MDQGTVADGREDTSIESSTGSTKQADSWPRSCRRSSGTANSAENPCVDHVKEIFAQAADTIRILVDGGDRIRHR